MGRCCPSQKMSDVKFRIPHEKFSKRELIFLPGEDNNSRLVEENDNGKCPTPGSFLFFNTFYFLLFEPLFLLDVSTPLIALVPRERR